jgi:hypothetical protein
MPTELADGLGLRGALLKKIKVESKPGKWPYFESFIVVKIRPEMWFLRSGFISSPMKRWIRLTYFVTWLPN